MNEALQAAKSDLQKAIWAAVDEFGSRTASLPEIDYCREAADVLEDRSELLRSREAELSRDEAGE